MENVNPADIQEGSFKQALKLCKDQADKFKDNPLRKAKYEKALEGYKKAQAKMSEDLEKCKNIKMVAGVTKHDGTLTTDGESFYDAFIGSRRSLVTLNWLGSKIEEQRMLGNIKEAESAAAGANVNTMSFTVADIEVKYDAFDRIKKFMGDMGSGKGISNFLLNGCLIAGASDILARFVTGRLGLLSQPTGILGVGSMLVQNAPTIWSAICSGVGSVWAFSPVIAVAAGGFLALKGIPMVKGWIDKAVKKSKDKHIYEKGMEKLMAEQDARALAL